MMSNEWKAAEGKRIHPLEKEVFGGPVMKTTKQN